MARISRTTVLGTIFYHYISDNLESYISPGEWEAGNTDFRYAEMSGADAEEARISLAEEQGFFILLRDLFCTIRRAVP